MANNENGTEAKTPKTHAFALIILILLVIVLGAEVFMLKKHTPDSAGPAEKTRASAPVVDVMPIAPQTVTVSKKYIGYVTPVHSVSVLPFISGFVERIYVQSGQTVRAGQLLMILEQGEYKAQLDLAEAAVMQAKASYENADTYFQRVQAAGPKAVAQADWDKAQAACLSAKAELAQAQARYAAAKVNYDYTIIRAPISGLVGTVEPTKGDYVSPAGQPLMQIIQTSPIQVVFSITDKDYITNVLQNGFANLMAGEQIKLQLSNGEFYPFSGEFQYADNRLNRATNSIAVYVNFENRRNILLSDAYVNVFLEKPLKNVVLLPQKHVSLTPDGNFISIADGRTIRKQKVDIIDSVGTDYVVENTFKTGDYLITGRVPELKENQTFRLNIRPRGE